MKIVTIETLPEEQILLEYYLFQYKGSEIAINQFLANTKYNYSKEHLERIGNKLSKKRKDLNDYTKKVILNHGYEELINTDIKFDIYPSMLKVYVNKNNNEVSNGNTR